MWDIKESNGVTKMIIFKNYIIIIFCIFSITLIFVIIISLFIVHCIQIDVISQTMYEMSFLKDKCETSIQLTKNSQAIGINDKNSLIDIVRG